MTLPKTIVVPIDFSACARLALNYAVELAAKLDASIHIVHAVGAQLFGTEVGLTVTQQTIDQIVEQHRVALDGMVAERAGQAAFGPVSIEVGDARSIIAATAERLRADLIVMGTHGRRGITRALLGSVAETVVRTAPCAVLTVRLRESSDSDRHAA